MCTTTPETSVFAAIFDHFGLAREVGRPSGARQRRGPNANVLMYTMGEPYDEVRILALDRGGVIDGQRRQRRIDDRPDSLCITQRREIRGLKKCVKRLVRLDVPVIDGRNDECRGRLTDGMTRVTCRASMSDPVALSERYGSADGSVTV